MKPTLEDLKRLLTAQPLPEPAEGARDRALRAALTELGAWRPPPRKSKEGSTPNVSRANITKEGPR